MVIRDLDDLADLGCSYFRNPPITVYYCLIESSSPPCISGDNSPEIILQRQERATSWPKQGSLLRIDLLMIY